jgi:hypothetical protein
MASGRCRKKADFKNREVRRRKRLFFQAARSIVSLPMVTKSIITCPICGFATEKVMPIGACEFFYECTNCKTVLKPKAGDCCIFCSYGSVRCPPKQSELLPHTT